MSNRNKKTQIETTPAATICQPILPTPIKESRAPAARKIVLIGNPNVGKSVIFGQLTGTYTTVSNYPGTTVEVATGKIVLDGKGALLVDTPGINNLIPISEDEVVTRNILLIENPALVVQVADAKNFRRSLFITLQLLEMEVPLILNINMLDEATERGIQIDSNRLANELGIPIAETVATRKKGIDYLNRLLRLSPSPPAFVLHYSYEIEEAIQQLTQILPATAISKRSLALMILSRDTSLHSWLFNSLTEEQIAQVNQICADVQSKLNQPISYLITQQRMNQTQDILARVVHEEPLQRPRWLQWCDNLLIHPVWGSGVVLFILFFMFEFVGVFGAGTLVNFFETKLFNQWLLPPLVRLIHWALPWQVIKDFLIGDYGLISMALTYAIAIVLPIVTTFF